jgi:hypothetical protein
MLSLCDESILRPCPYPERLSYCLSHIGDWRRNRRPQRAVGSRAGRAGNSAPCGADVGIDAATGDTFTLTGSGDAEPVEKDATGGGGIITHHYCGHKHRLDGRVRGDRVYQLATRRRPFARSRTASAMPLKPGFSRWPYRSFCRAGPSVMAHSP